MAVGRCDHGDAGIRGIPEVTFCPTAAPWSVRLWRGRRRRCCGQLAEVPDLEGLATQIAELRPLPACAIRILEVCEGERFFAHDLASVIASDQAVTAKLRRLANSAYYGFPRRITTVRDAVVLLGFREVRAATVVSCMMDSVPGSTNIDYNQFWQFSLSVGMLGEPLARTESEHRDHAFTAGVLHNIGRLALDQHVPGALSQAIDAARRHGAKIEEAERRLLGYSDVELGAAIAEPWNFPPELVEAIVNHTTPLHELRNPGSLTALVVRARAFAQFYGVAEGINTSAFADPPPMVAVEWGTPPLSTALEEAGGMQQLMECVDICLESATAS